MTVKPETIENPERDLALTTRKEDRGKLARSTDAEELQRLRRRIAAARETMPKDSTPHCGDCYRRGWAAALKSLEE